MRRVLAGLLVAAGVSACAPPPAPEPPPPSTDVTASMKIPFDVVKNNVTLSLEQLPEDRLGYSATPEVRSFAQLFGHIADSNYMLCGMGSGEAGPGGSVEDTVTAKADLAKAVADSFAFCDRAFAGLNDQTGAEPVTISFLNADSTRLGVLSFQTAHLWEHYGNIVTYLRLNKMVPPSSQQQPAPQDGGM